MVDLTATLAAPRLDGHPPRETIRAHSIAPPSIESLPEIQIDRDAPLGNDLALGRTLGEGGMGRVYLATQHSLRREVAVKTCLDQEESAASLVHEGVVTGMLEHPNIPPVHALGRDESGRPVLVMKRIEGTSWHDALLDRSLVENLEILIQICNALQLAHERGVIHRDIKPANVMLGRYGEVYLIDWGVAHVRAFGADASLVGSPAYIAPEMAAGGEPDARTDVYLIAATLHEILTGAPPHDAPTARVALQPAMLAPPPTFNDSVPTELSALCTRGLAKRPDDRPQSAREVQLALRSYLAHRGAATLTSEARDRLEQLRLATDPATRARLSTECRFGFHQALRAWPESREARAGLTEALTYLAEREIDAEDLEGARQLIAELPDDVPELSARAATLESKLRARDERRRAALAQAREMDARVAVRERALVNIVGATIGAVLLWLDWQRPTPALFGYQAHVTMVRVALLIAAVTGVTLLLVRRRMMQNTFNRRWAALLGIGVAMLVLHRTLALQLLPGAPATAMSDLLLAAVMLAIAGVHVGRALFFSALVFCVGAAGIAFLPTHTPAIADSTMLIGIAAATFALRTIARANSERELPD